jgi:hypothetical protein
MLRIEIILIGGILVTGHRYQNIISGRVAVSGTAPKIYGQESSDEYLFTEPMRGSTLTILGGDETPLTRVVFTTGTVADYRLTEIGVTDISASGQMSMWDRADFDRRACLIRNPGKEPGDRCVIELAPGRWCWNVRPCGDIDGYWSGELIGDGVEWESPPEVSEPEHLMRAGFTVEPYALNPGDTISIDVDARIDTRAMYMAVERKTPAGSQLTDDLAALERHYARTKSPAIDFGKSHQNTYYDPKKRKRNRQDTRAEIAPDPIITALHALGDKRGKRW